jgi:hypothetical protein
MTLFRHNGKLAFFAHIPKTGGTSVGYAMVAAGALRSLHYPGNLGYGACTAQHMHAEIYGNLIPTEFCDYGFTVVRHPTFRIFSEFRYLRDRYGLTLKFDEWVRLNLERYQLNSYVLDNHIRPQVEFMIPTLEVFRNEDGLEKPIAKAAEVLGLAGVNTSNRELVASEISVELRSETFEQLLDFYRPDFEAFDYSRDQVPTGIRIRSRRRLFPRTW